MEDMMQSVALIGPGNFTYSAIRIDKLESTEYTLVHMVVDKSPSVFKFAKELTDCQIEIIKSCQKSPRMDNLLLRNTQFNENIEEINGFIPLSSVDVNSYPPVNPSGWATALFDATDTAIQSVDAYAKNLFDSDYKANSVIFVVTDGMDNKSTRSAASIKQRLEDVRKSEHLESIEIALVGVTNGDNRLKDYLQNLATEAGMNKFIDISDANGKELAKLAGWISKSISSSSTSLGKGTKSSSMQHAF
jgi:uncharacterized protein YegL